MVAVARWAGCASLAMAGVWLQAASAAAPPAPESARQRIVVLNSYHPGFQWSDHIVEGIREALAKSPHPIELLVEHLDSKRHPFGPDSPVLRQTLDLLEAKYAGHPPALVIACDDNAFQLALAFRGRLFGKAPLVFCGVNAYEPAMLEGQQAVTGVVEVVDHIETIDLMLRLHPRARTVAIVTDTTTSGAGNRLLLQRLAHRYQGRAELVFVDAEGTGLTFQQLLERLAALPPEAVILWRDFFRDRQGRYYDPAEVLEYVSPRISRPIYAIGDFYMGHGIVGGRINTGHAQGLQAGRMAVEILGGTPAGEIPIVQRSLNQWMFDWRQLKRFGIDPAQLPADSLIIERPFSFYETYKALVWSVAAVVGVLSTLVILLLLNIARRHRVEQALRESEARHRLLAENSRDMISRHRLDGTYLYVSPACRSLLGVEPDALVGTSPFDRIHPDDVPIVREGHERLLDRGESWMVDYRLRHTDGRYIHVETSATKTAADGEDAIVCVTRDISERIEQQRQQRQFERRMQQAQKLESLGVLAGGIAHDFNNILVAILGQAELAQMELNDPASARDSIEEIRRAAIRASELANQMLAYSGRGQFEVRPLALNDLVDEMSRLLEVTIPKHVDLRRSLGEDLPPVNADAVQIRQVVMNLLTNAAEAIGDQRGTIELTTAAVDRPQTGSDDSWLFGDSLADGRYVLLEVRDTGCGMSRDVRKRIFDPFFTTKFTGRGLGLAAVLGIVRGHGGAMQVVSRPGEGSTFRIWLPATSRSAKARAPQEAPPAGQTSLSGLTVLVADDETPVRTVARRMLEHVGCRVIEAADGQEAVERIETIPAIDAVLLDLTMPRIGGTEAFGLMRQHRPGLPVVVTSGFSAAEAAGRFGADKPDAFLQKPFAAEDLFARLSLALATRAAAKAGGPADSL